MYANSKSAQDSGIQSVFFMSSLLCNFITNSEFSALTLIQSVWKCHAVSQAISRPTVANHSRIHPCLVVFCGWEVMLKLVPYSLMYSNIPVYTPYNSILILRV